MKKLFFPLLVAVFTAVQAFAYDFSAVSPSGHTLYYSYVSKTDKTANVTYEINNGSEYYETQPEGDLIIPATVENEGVQYTVVGIGSCAFFGCKKIKSVVIQEGITTIDLMAFQNCERLQSVTLPETMETIGKNAFYNCVKLNSINLPNSLISLGQTAFCNCSSLESITIPNSIKTIESYTFMQCNNLVSITLPEKLTIIKEYAFHSCEKLQSITLPNSLTSIDKYAFYCTYAMTSISIPASVTEIGQYAFYNPYLKNLFLNSTNPPYIGEDFVQYNIPNIYVPCNAIGNYQNDEDWELYKDYLKTTKHKVLLLSTDKHGYATIEAENMCDDEYEATLSVFYQSDYTFGGWSDGNKENPRTITVTKDTSFTALFGEKPQINNLQQVNPICTSATGSISFEVTNGVAPYTITWSDGGTGTSRSEMTAGKYYFYATDQEGFSSDTVFVTLAPSEENIPDIALLPYDPICESSTGSIIVFADGGTEPYTYKWEKQDVVDEKVWNFDKHLNSILEGLDGTATLYGAHNFNNPTNFTKEALSLTDGGALESKRSIHVDISMDSVLLFKLELPFKNDYTPVYYDEDHEDVYFEHYDEANIATNTYGLSFYHKGSSLNLYVLDKNGDQSTKISIPYHLNWTQMVIPWKDLTREDVIAIVFASSNYQYGTGKEFDFSIDEVSILMYNNKETFSSESDIANLTAGKYTLTLSDAYGCSITKTVELHKDFSQEPLVQIVPRMPTCETHDGVISLYVDGEDGEYTYLWEDGSTESIRRNLAAGEYSATVTDQNGCNVSISTTLEKNYSYLPQVSVFSTNPHCTAADGGIYVEPIDEYASYTYSWSNTTDWPFADFENGLQSNIGSQIKIYNDSESIGGYTDVSNSGIANDGVNGSNHSFQLSASSFTPGSYYGVDNAGFTLSLDHGIISIDKSLRHSLGLSFYHKGDACAVGIDNTYKTVRVPEHSDWTLVTVYWERDLEINPNQQEISNISWSYRHEFSSKSEIQFQIDEVSFLLKLEAEEGNSYKTNLPAETYLLSVSDDWGCVTEEIIALTVDESATPIIHKEATNAICGHDVGEISISIENGSPSDSYSWEDTEDTDLKRENLSEGTYIFTVTNRYGCTASDTTEIEYETFKYQPEIALVTVSQESPANLVVWQKEETQAIDFYSIYRETSSANNYEKIADVPFNQTSIYLDENTDSQTKAYRYKISATDNCGYESPLSTNHKTINATASLGVGGVVNLIWDGYEGFDFSTYSIYRITKDDKNPVQPIDQVPSTNWTYVDKNAPENTLAYYVAVKLPKTIDVNEPFVKAESGPFILAISNIAEIESQGGTGISTVDGNAVNVYGTNNAIVIENTGENQITICNAMGQTIVRAKGMNETKRSFNVENGIYIVIVGNKAFKVVVE